MSIIGKANTIHYIPVKNKKDKIVKFLKVKHNSSLYDTLITNGKLPKYITLDEK